MQQAISCYIRTLNEEERIGEVLEAAGRVADELIVVDSGSTDRTREIAESHGARVIDQSWLGNGAQKRVGEDACRHDWLLDLDADEVLTDDLVTEIKALFARGEVTPEAFELPLVFVPPHGKPWYGFARSRRVKLYDRRAVRIPDHPAWDQPELPDGLTPGRLNAPILHYSFRSIEHMVMKMNRVSTARLNGKRLLSRPVVVGRVFFGFPVYFFKNYILRGMVRGGAYGFSVAAILAMGRWLRDVKMYERHAQTD
jgi:glycosyltransferase involved in cell wall biosynthesis